MAIRTPILNPLRFYKGTELPNYSSRWPGIDNISFFTEWQKGVYSSKFYRDLVLNQEISIQFQYDGAITDQNISVFQLNQLTGNYELFETLTPVDISPAGWIDIPVYKYTFTPSVVGVFYMDFNDPDLLSDRFIVHNESKYLKQLVEIKYSHYENRFGMVYLDGITPVFQGKAFFQGRLIIGEPKNEFSEYVDDPGNLELLQATPQRSVNVQLFTIHYSYADLINLIFSNSEIFINGVDYQNADSPSLEYIENSDLVNMTIKLFQKETDYFRNI